MRAEHEEGGSERENNESAKLWPELEIENSELHDISTVGNYEPTIATTRGAPWSTKPGRLRLICY